MSEQEDKHNSAKRLTHFFSLSYRTNTKLNRQRIKGTNTIFFFIQFQFVLFEKENRRKTLRYIQDKYLSYNFIPFSFKSARVFFDPPEKTMVIVFCLVLVPAKG